MIVQMMSLLQSLEQGQGTHSNCVFEFHVFSLSDRNFCLGQFTWFVTITYTKLPYPDPPKKRKFSRQILKYLWPLESGNLQLEQTKFPVLWQNFQIPCVSLTGNYFLPCSLFSLCSRYPEMGTVWFHVLDWIIQKACSYTPHEGLKQRKLGVFDRKLEESHYRKTPNSSRGLN